jgi:lycopene cyclase CruA
MVALKAERSHFEALRGRYPLTVAAFSQMPEGERALGAVLQLERKWVALNRGEEQPNPFNYVPTAADLPPTTPDREYDVVIAGGGLGLVAGAALARRGLRVLVFDRDRVGAAHREWNISARELEALVRGGLFTWDELRGATGTQYRRGLIQFSAEGTGVPACSLELDGVLDVALDAQAVLDLARRRFLDAGGTIREGLHFRRLHIAEGGEVASVFEVDGPEGAEHYRSRLAIDTMGAVSPIAMGLNGGVPFNGVCPTAGTVVEGLDLDPEVGDVLVSIGPATEGRQMIWEGFPGAGGETTVYLFYYDRTGLERAERQSLLDLFERYFRELPAYKSALPNFRHLRPVFGYIPARFGRAGRTAARGLVCLGDSAAGQSPLTFCGFGSFVRHIGRVSRLLHYALRNSLLEESHLRQIGPQQANLRVAWVFSRLMQPWEGPGGGPYGVNRLMNVFSRALSNLGEDLTVRFLQDRYSFGEYMRILLTTARHYPTVFAITASVLGPGGLLKWAGDIAAFALDDAARLLYRAPGRRVSRRVERALRRVAPSLALTLMSRRTNWEATR